MKKILTSAICLALAAAVLTACSDKVEQNKDDVGQENDAQNQEAVIEIPEEQKVFEVEIDRDFDIDALKIVGYTGEAEELEIPATLINPKDGTELPVLSIGEAAFLGNETLVKVTVPEGVLKIKAGAFQSCSALTYVVLPEGLETIGNSAFENSKLTNINIPSTVKEIGTHAFSTMLNPTPWYAAQTAQSVIVGDGILLKYNGKGDVTYGSEVKSVAYYAFRSPGAINVRFNSDLENFDKMAVYETEGNYLINFLIPYKSNAGKLLEATPYAYTVHGVTAVEGNPFKWTFDSAADIISWYGGNLDISFSADGAIHGKARGVDYQFCCNDKINIPAELFKTMVIRMKHETGAAIDEGAVNKNIQVYFDNGSGLSEAASVKLEVLPSSNGEYVDYTLDMGACEAWKNIITYFRIDTLQGLEGEFWLDSVEFIPEDPAFDFNTLLKPITKYVPSEENPYKYKFEDEAKATAWTMTGFEYSYAPIAVDGENDSIHGILDPAVESSITSPVVNVPGVAYRKLIVRVRSAFDEKTAENKDNYKLKVYFDNGEGFSEERSLTMDIEQNSGTEKVEYKFDMYKLDGWYGTVKQVKVVLPENMGGEFWIDKVEFEPEDKLTKAGFITMLYEAESKPSIGDGESIFVDVVTYDKYCNAVIWATQNGFVSRVADNKFNPDSLITPEEYARIMNEYAKLKGAEATFEAAAANTPIYKMDAKDAIDSIINPPAEDAAE